MQNPKSPTPEPIIKHESMLIFHKQFRVLHWENEFCVPYTYTYMLQPCSAIYLLSHQHVGMALRRRKFFTCSGFSDPQYYLRICQKRRNKSICRDCSSECSSPYSYIYHSWDGVICYEEDYKFRNVGKVSSLFKVYYL